MFIVESLIGAGADCNIPTSDSKKTPVQLASDRGFLLVLKQLLDGGGKVNIAVSTYGLRCQGLHPVIYTYKRNKNNQEKKKKDKWSSLNTITSFVFEKDHM